MEELAGIADVAATVVVVTVAADDGEVTGETEELP